MVRQSLPRRRVLALTGSALLGGCLGSTPEGANPSESTTDDESDAPMTNGPPAVEGSWAQLGRDAGHDGYNPSVPSTCSDVRWTVETEGPLTTPTVANDTVYVTRGNLTGGAPEATLEAYELSSGDRKWSVSLDTTYVFHAPLSDLRPVYHDGNLYLNVDEAFVAIDAETRRTRWKTSGFDGFINDPPVVTDDAVYGAGTKGPRLLRTRWEQTVGVRTGRTHVSSVVSGGAGRYRLHGGQRRTVRAGYGDRVGVVAKIGR